MCSFRFINLIWNYCIYSSYLQYIVPSNYLLAMFPQRYCSNIERVTFPRLEVSSLWLALRACYSVVWCTILHPPVHTQTLEKFLTLLHNVNFIIELEKRKLVAPAWLIWLLQVEKDISQLSTSILFIYDFRKK